MVVMVMVVVMMYKLRAQEQQLAAAESNANRVAVNDSNTLWNNTDRETLRHSMFTSPDTGLPAVVCCLL